MHRHVRRIGDERAVAVKHRAGEIEPLLDVHRIGGVLQRHAHLLGDRHEQVVEHFEHHRIGVGADRARALEFLHPPQHQVILRRQLGLPAVLDDDRLMRLDDDGGAFDFLTRRKRVARVDQRALPFAVGEKPRAARRRRKLGPRGLARFFLKRRAAADRLDRHRLDTSALLRSIKPNCALCARSKADFIFGERAAPHLPLQGRGGVRAGDPDDHSGVSVPA